MESITEQNRKNRKTTKLTLDLHIRVVVVQEQPQTQVDAHNTVALAEVPRVVVRVSSVSRVWGAAVRTPATLDLRLLRMGVFALVVLVSREMNQGKQERPLKGEREPKARAQQGNQVCVQARVWGVWAR